MKASFFVAITEKNHEINLEEAEEREEAVQVVPVLGHGFSFEQY